MSRPRKAPGAKSDAMLHFRCTAAEKQRIAANAKRADLTQSVYLKRMALDGELTPTSPLLAAVTAINRAGNLVNQQMHIAHRNGELPAELVSLNADLAAAVKSLLILLDRTIH